MINIKLSGGRRVWAGVFPFSILIGLLVAMLSGSLQIKGKIPADVPFDSFQLHMEERIPALMKAYRIPGCSIALVHDYKILWTQGFGYADIKSGRYLTPDTPMSVQSITKSVTAWGVMKLVEKGLIDLDAPLSTYLTSWHFPHTNNSIEKVTIRRLLSHTAGMPPGDFTDIYAPGEEMPTLRDKLTQEAILLSEPGTGFSYSNVGYHLLELLIEDISGKSFAQYIHSELFLPMGIETAGFDINKTTISYPPTGYDLSGKPVPVYIYPEKASGGLFATVGDIALFAIAGMQNNPVLSNESIDDLYTPECNRIGVYSMVFDAYGFGYYIETLPNGMRSVSHGGQGNGIMTHFQAVPESGDAIVILTNSQRSWPFISYILSDWAQWRSFSPVGMEKIIWAHYGLSFIVGIIICACFLMVLRLFIAIYKKERVHIKPLRIIIALLLLGILLWCATRKYLMLSSVFPVLSVWLYYAILTLSIAFLLPTNHKDKVHNDERAINEEENSFKANH